MRKWTSDEWDEVKAMLEMGVDRQVIANRVGRALGCLKEKIRWERLTVEQKAAKLKAIRDKRAAENAAKGVKVRVKRRKPVIPPSWHCEKAMAARDAREIELKQRSITAQLCGDPPPSQSALFKQQRASA